MPISLEPSLNSEDQHFIYALILKEAAKKFPFLPTNQQTQLAELQVRAKLSTFESNWPNAVKLMVLNDNCSIGFIIINDEPDNIVIVDLLIDDKYRNKGLGGQIISQLCQKANLDKKQSINLSVAVGNPAITLYLRHDFKVIHQNQTQIDMKKVLSR